MKWYGQFLEDKWIYDNLKLPINGTYCDVGAYDGIESSNTYAFEQMGWRGMCIEAVPESWSRCRNNRKCYVFCSVASDSDRMVDFHTNDAELGLSGVNAPGRAERLCGTKVDFIWRTWFGGHLNLLSIDTEGSELQVWAGAKSLKPDILVIEYRTDPNPPRDKEIVAELTQDGYKEIMRTHANLILIREIPL